MDSYFYARIEKFNRRHRIYPLKNMQAKPGDLYLRLWTLPPYDRPGKLYGISKVSNQWHCNIYASGQRYEIERNTKNWEESMAAFLKNDIETLPDQSKLTWDLYNADPKKWQIRRIYILHAWFFYIEIFWNSRFHSFSYYAPHVHYWPEARKMSRILDEFHKIHPLAQRD